MKIRRCRVINFGSYPELELDFTNKSGLSLVYGKTGSGKSTILDAVCWCLYGRTAKGGTSDQIRSWYGEGATSGEIEVELNDSTIIVNRSRGSSNDLYWTENYSDPTRGKDLTDTQRLLTERLGVSEDLYFTAAYFHEFSPAVGFFTAKAKDRRELFENIADLSLPGELQEKLTALKKSVKNNIAKKELELASASGKYTQLISTRDSTIKNSSRWEKDHAHSIILIERALKNYDAETLKTLEETNKKAASFEEDKNNQIASLTTEIAELNALAVLDSKFHSEIAAVHKIRQLSKICSACNQSINLKEETDKKSQLLKSLNSDRMLNQKLLSRIQSLEAQLYEINKSTNVHADMALVPPKRNPHIAILSSEKSKVNPFIINLESLAVEIKFTNDLITNLNTRLDALGSRQNALNFLQWLGTNLRSELLKQAINAIQGVSNDSLSKHFDSELRIALNLGESDDLNIQIQKSGYDCSFKQLSRGQRSLLILCFGIAVMSQASALSGVHFDNLFFDEALDGLDSDLKIKAFSLFESLSKEHESIFLIDHAVEFQNLFDKRFHVTIDSDISKIEEEFE